MQALVRLEESSSYDVTRQDLAVLIKGKELV